MHGSQLARLVTPSFVRLPSAVSSVIFLLAVAWMSSADEAALSAQSRPIPTVPTYVVRFDDEAGLLNGIAGAVRTNDGRFLLASSYGGVVVLLDSTGSIVRMIGRAGSGPGEFRNISWIGRCTPNSAFVYDRQNARMTVIEFDGELRREFSLTDQDGGPVLGEFFACSTAGTLAVQSMGRESVPQAASAGTVRMRAPVWSGSAKTGVLRRVTETLSGEMIVLGGGAGPAPLGRRSVLAVSGTEIVIGTGEHPSLTAIGVAGTQREMQTGIPLRPSSPVAFRAGIEEVLALLPPPVVPRIRPLIERAPVPAALAPYETLRADECGRLWISYRRSEGGGPGIRVLSRSGGVLGDAHIVAPVTIWDVSGGFVTGVAQDDDGRLEIHVFRIALEACP